jgi:hypothetical protein
VCHARPDQEESPAGETVRECCNLGYARGRCQRFPPGCAEDALRFSVTAHDHGLIRLVYVVEAEHLPLAHGALEYSVPLARLDGAAGVLLLAQARAFVESYLASAAGFRPWKTSAAGS